MRKLFLKLLILSLFISIIYAVWILLDSDYNSNPYGKNEINYEDLNRIVKNAVTSDTGDTELNGKEYINRIIEASSSEYPISENQALQMAQNLIKRFAIENDVMIESSLPKSVSSSGKYMWIIEFNTTDHKSYWVLFDKYSRTKITDNIDIAGTP